MSNGNDRDDAPPPEGMPPEGNGTPMESGKPAVAAAPGKMMFVLLAAGVFLIIVIKSLFFSSSPPAPKPEKHVHESVAQGVKSPDVLPTLPPPPTVEKELPPPPPPPALEQPKAPNFSANAAPNDERLKARVKSSMIVSTGGLHGAGGGDAKKGKKAGAGTDPNSAFADSLEGTSAERVEATTIGNLNITLAQGKIIHAVLESAINSDLPGPIRAIVSHDIYAESGKDILIPKGSRLIGVYNPSLKRGQARMFIIWTRVIRPDGIDVAINSPGVDALGRAGLGGDIDNKYFEAFSAALLTSALDIGTAVAGASALPNTPETQNTNSLGTTTTTTPSAQAIQQGVQQAVQNIGQVGTSIVGSTATLTPTITVDQGTLVNVFVNKDVVFPTELNGMSHFVQ